MKIEFGEAWNGIDGQYPNHESLRTQEDVCRLLEQIRLLHGISTKDWTGMPKYIKLKSTELSSHLHAGRCA